MMDWTAYKQLVRAEKNENQGQSLAVFAEALLLAEQHDMVLTQHTDIHFSLTGQTKRGGTWRLNIYPSNQRLWSDTNYRGPFLMVTRPWTLLDVVQAAINQTEKKGL